MSKGKTKAELSEKPGKPTFVIIAIQILLIVFFAIELFSIIEMDFNEEGNLTYLALSRDIVPYAFMFLIAFTLYSIHLISKRKRTRTHELMSDAQFIIKTTTGIKLRRSKENPFAIALLAMEIGYALLIMLAIIYYFDPDLQFAWWEDPLLKEAGLELVPPVTAIINIVVFALITAFFLYMHHFAAQFNAMKFQGRKGFKRREDQRRKR